MRLVESDSALDSLCREIERRVAIHAPPEVAELTLPVELPGDFAALVADLGGSARMAAGPALYQRSPPRVLVNGPVLFATDLADRLAMLAHEIAHAGYADETEADLLACRMGFADELAAERGRSRPEYAAALRLWEDSAAAREAVTFARWRRIAEIGG